PRAGRNGNPGEAQFYGYLDHELFQRYADDPDVARFQAEARNLLAQEDSPARRRALDELARQHADLIRRLQDATEFHAPIAVSRPAATEPLTGTPHPPPAPRPPPRNPTPPDHGSPPPPNAPRSRAAPTRANPARRAPPTHQLRMAASRPRPFGSPPSARQSPDPPTHIRPGLRHHAKFRGVPATPPQHAPRPSTECRHTATSRPH